MKKVLAVLIIFAIICLATGCGYDKTNRSTVEKPHLMTIIDETDMYTIYVNNDSGVMYFSTDRGGHPSVCVMVNEDGSPLIYDDK